LLDARHADRHVIQGDRPAHLVAAAGREAVHDRGTELPRELAPAHLRHVEPGAANRQPARAQAGRDRDAVRDEPELRVHPQPALAFAPAPSAPAGARSGACPSTGSVAGASPFGTSAIRLISPLASRSSARRGSSSSTLSSSTVLRKSGSQATFTANRFHATRGGPESGPDDGAVAPGRTTTSFSAIAPRRSARSTSPISTRARSSLPACEARSTRR